MNYKITDIYNGITTRGLLMNIWEILEIEPTIEIKLIKTAYAKKLKIYNPEDDPQSYQSLRAAYDSALKFAKNNKLHELKNLPSENDKSYEENTIIYEENDNMHYDKYNPPIVNDFVNKMLNRQQIVDKFFEKVQALYIDFFSRIDEINWEELLNDDIMWQFDYKPLINNRILGFLKHHHYLPKTVWKLLDDNFHFKEQEENLKSYYTESFMKYLFKQISKERVPGFCNFKRSIKVNYEEYLNYREGAFIALFENDLKKAEYYISMAYKMYSKDPDLLCMKGEYLLRNGRNFRASVTFKAAIKINSSDSKIHLYQAQIMMNNKNLQKAIKIYKYLNSRTPNNLEIRICLSNCYFKMGQWYKSSKLLLGNLKIEPNHIESMLYLKQVADHFRKMLKTDHTFNLRLRWELRRIYKALDEFEEIEKMKITSDDILKLLKKMFIILCKIFGVLALMAIVVGSGGAAIVVIVIIRMVRRSNK